MTVSGKIEIAANSATVLVAVLLSAVLIKLYLLPSKAPQSVSRLQAPAEVKVGDNLEMGLPGINWQQNGRTLILAISTDCHFCRESAPFFRAVAGNPGRGFKVVAVLPQPADTATKYLEAEGVHVDHVEQLALARIGVRGTPTILLVDSAGVVQNVWVGKLESVQEGQVLATLGLKL